MSTVRVCNLIFLTTSHMLVLLLAAVIICVYEEPILPEQAATVTEKLGEYLISVGY